MIVAAGLSPAWQQVLVVEDFQSGEVNRAAEAYWCASGKVINVALALHHLSGGRNDQSLVLSTLGGAAFEPIDRELAELGLARRWVRTATPTRVCTTIVDRRSGVATELVENAGAVTPAELNEFEKSFSEAAADADVVVLTGSLPTGAPPDFYLKLLRVTQAPTVLDCRGPELLAALQARPAVVKPNRAELAATLGQPLSTDAKLHDAMAELMRRGARAVVVTSGKECVWTLSDEGLQKFTPPPVDRIVNPIGCGDCFAAGLAWALARQCTLAESVERGMDTAKANLGTLLPGDLDGRRQRLAAR